MKFASFFLLNFDLKDRLKDIIIDYGDENWKNLNIFRNFFDILRIDEDFWRMLQVGVIEIRINDI